MKLEMTYMPETGLKVRKELFGGNHLYTKNGVEADGSFAQAVDYLGVDGLRYPGGTMTEVWGPDFYADPNTLTDAAKRVHTFVGLDDFLSFAADSGQAATIVLPTRHLFVGTAEGDAPRELDEAAVADIATFVRDMLETHGEANIAALEIGNEYWSDVVGMTSAEYGIAANAVAVAIQDVLDDMGLAGADQPKIFVQMGASFGREFASGGAYADRGLEWGERETLANSDILNALSDAAMRAIDGVIEHYYYVETDSALTLGDSPASAADRYFRSISWDREQWGAAFNPAVHGALDLLVSEWGPSWYIAELRGLQGAGVVLEMFEGLLRLGADAAHVWPIELDGAADFAGSHKGDGDDSDKLTAQGEAFRLMAEHTVGLELVNNGFDETDAGVETVEVNAFASDDRFVVFLSSRDGAAQEVTLDVSAYVPGFDTLSGELIHLIDKNAPVDEAAWFATTTEVTAEELGNSTLIDTTLDPYEVLMVTFELSEGLTVSVPDRVRITGEMDGEEINGTNASDEIWGLAGDDVIDGKGGDDLIHGNRGGDVIRGGDGDDFTKGRLGSDEIWGGYGDDDLRGNRGNDIIFGEEGNDLLKGCRGDDWLWGGDGDDRLIGGRGNDVIGGGVGHDILTGGSGADQFVFVGLGSNQITDFEAGQDKIDLTKIGTSFAALRFTDEAAGVTLEYGEGTVLFDGLTADDLGADDFLF